MQKILFILIFIISILGQAQPPAKFYSTYGGNGYDEGYDVKQTLDGGYIITGSTSSFGQGNTDLYLLKLDSMGVKKFETSFGGVSNEIGKSVVQLIDSSYVIAGYTSSTGVGGYDIFLVKADKTGALIWQKTIGGTDWDFAYSMEATADGGFIITGTTYSYGRGNADGYVVKTDANGNVIWQKTYGGVNDDEFKSVIQTSDGKYALTGYTKSYNDIDSGDVWVFKLEVNGDSAWCKFYGGGKEDFGNQIIEHPSGDLYIAGASRSFSSGSIMDGYIVHTDNNGVYIFQRLDNTSTSFQEFVSIVVSNKSQNIVNTIAKETFAAYGLQSKMLEMNLGLNYISAIDFGSVLNDHTYKMIATKDKGYACIGYTNGYNSILSNCYFVKVDSNLQGSLFSIVSVQEFNIDRNKVSIFPNPTSNQLIFQLTGISIDISKVKIYDLFGKEINVVNEIVINSKNQIMINVSDLKSGIYYLKYFNHSEKISIIH